MSKFINEYIIYFISFLDILAVALIVPLQSVHYRSLGASHFVIGVFGSTYSAVQVLSGPLIGCYSDIRGRKNVLLVSALCSSLLYTAFGAAQTLYVIFFIRFTLGLVKHTQTLCKALIVDGFSSTQHASKLGKMTALSSMGFVIGPFLSGHIYKQSNGFSYICYMSAALLFTIVGLAMTLPEKNKLKKAPETKQNSAQLHKISTELMQPVQELLRINWSVHGKALAIKFLFGLAGAIIMSTSSLYISEKYGLSQLNIGYIISFQGTVGALTSFLVGYITRTFYANDKSGRKILHAFGLLTLSLISMYFAGNVYVFVAFLIPFAVASSFSRVISTELLLSNSSEDERGTISGASNSAMSLARMVAPVSSGIAMDLFGKDSVICFAMVPAVLGAVLSYRMRSRKVKAT